MDELTEESIGVADALRIVEHALRDENLEVAETLCARVLEIEPESPYVLNLWGAVCVQLKRFDEAISVIQQAIRIDPSFTAAYSNLGNLFFLQSQFEEAEYNYRKAIELAPDKPQAYNNLGHLLFRLKRYSEAMKCYEMAVSISPDFIHLYERLGVLVARSCGPVEGAELFKDWLQKDPGNPIAEHMLSVCEAQVGKDARPRCDPEYVKATFDRFAPSFDQVLTGLKYQAPRLVAGRLEELLGQGKGDLVVLDAGCGTGLCAQFLRPYSKTLVGVDLSAGMLSKAKDRQLYDELIEADLLEFMRNSDVRFDLIVSADTLLYFGELTEVFQAALGSLRSGGLFVFSLESSTKAGGNWELTSSGRYVHTLEYLKRSLRATGWDQLEIGAVSLRSEHGLPVSGWLVAVRKATVSADQKSL